MKVNKFVSFCYNKSALQSITNEHLSNLFWPENQYPPIPIGLAFVYECNIVDAGCKYSRLALPNIWIWQKKNLLGFASKYSWFGYCSAWYKNLRFSFKFPIRTPKYNVECKIHRFQIFRIFQIVNGRKSISFTRNPHKILYLRSN